MPEPMTERGRPSTMPVKPSIPRTSVTRRASGMSAVAILSARRGSPGMRTAGAKSPGSALIWVVAMMPS